MISPCPSVLDWTDSLSVTTARAAARIERTLRHDAERWARQESAIASAAEDELSRAVAFAAPFAWGSAP